MPPRPTPPHHPLRSRLVALVAVATVLLVAATLAPAGGAGPAPAQAGGGDVSQYLSQLNQTRSRSGLPPLTLDGELSGTAQAWAGQLASWGRLQHASDLSIGVSQPWVKLGENVGRGPNSSVIFNAFVASPTHYNNIVDGSFTRVGIGVVWSGDTQYVVHRFLAPGATAPPPPPPPAPPPPPTGGGGGGGGDTGGEGPTADPPDTSPPPTDEPPPPTTGPGDPVRAAAVLTALHALDGGTARLDR